MKAQCERCKEIVALDFTVEGDAIAVRCPACAAEYTVPGRPAKVVVAADLARAPAPAGETMTCPKCGDLQKPAEACRRCGLIIANWRPELAALPSPGEAGEAAALWAACEDGWADAARHDAFIEHCRRAGILAFAAARYRMSGGRAGAGDKLERIRTLAEQTLASVPRFEPRPKRNMGVYVLVVLLLAAVFVIGWRYFLGSGMPGTP